MPRPNIFFADNQLSLAVKDTTQHAPQAGGPHLSWQFRVLIAVIAAGVLILVGGVAGLY